MIAKSITFIIIVSVIINKVTSNLKCYHSRCEMLPTTYDTTGTNRTRCMEYEGNFGNVTDCNLKDQLCAKITIVHGDNYLNTIVSRRCQVPQFDNITAGMCNQTSVMEKMLSNHYLHKNTTICYCDTYACNGKKNIAPELPTILYTISIAMALMMLESK